MGHRGARVRMVSKHESEHASQRAAATSIAEKIGYSVVTLRTATAIHFLALKISVPRKQAGHCGGFDAVSAALSVPLRDRRWSFYTMRTTRQFFLRD